MAKESMKNREAKRAKLVQRFAAKRAALKAIPMQNLKRSGMLSFSCKKCRAILPRFVSVIAVASPVVRTVTTASSA